MTAESFEHVEVIDLGRKLHVGMPKSLSHPDFVHVVQRRHGDRVRTDGGSAASDMVVLGTHVGTHIDALAHISQDGYLHGGLQADEAMCGGIFSHLGADEIEPFVKPCVLLDVAAHRRVPCCEGGLEISAADLRSCAESQGVNIPRGGVVLIRTGWGRHYDDAEAFIGLESGVPGVGEPAATWLAAQGVHAVGADTIALERIEPGKGHYRLPVHRILLVENGIYIIEAMDLEGLSAGCVYSFDIAVSPLNIEGATGAPVRPLAIVRR